MDKKYIITEPETIFLDDEKKTEVTVYPVNDVSEISPSLAECIRQTFNKEIEMGETYPLDVPMTYNAFVAYWFEYFAVIMVLGPKKSLLEERDWNKECYGSFYIRPNYVGICSHNCNAGFMVNHETRGKRVGTTLGKVYLRWATRLGYTYSVFNLVFETNVASLKIWDGLGFERIGRIKNGAYIKKYGRKVDAIMFGKDLV